MKPTNPMDRRTFIVVAGSAAVAIACGAKLDLGLTGNETFDEMLDALHTTEATYDQGLSNHAPMAAEALVALGAAGRAVPWVSEYSTRLELLDETSVRSGAIAAFEAELETLPPAEILEREIAALGPFWVGSGWHGVLRTAHAMRSLEREDTPSRRRELAHGLGYWASDRATLPGVPGRNAEVGLDVLAALEAIPTVPARDQVDSGRLPDRLAPVADLAGFAEAVEAVDLSVLPTDEAVHALCSAAGRAFVSQGGDSFLLLHAITGTSALRLLLPSLSPEAATIALGYAFQALAAAISASGAGLGPVGAPTLSLSEVVELCSEDDDEHTIKLGEAVMREVEFQPAPELLLAVERWLDR